MRKRKSVFSLLLAAAMLLSLGAGAVPAQAAAPEIADPGEPVRMIVELEEPKAFPLSLFAPTPSRETVKDAIRELVETAAPLSAESETAPEVTFGYDYSVLLQGFSLTAPEGYLDEIRALRGVRNAYAAQTYTLAEPDGGWSNADTQAVVGTQAAHARGYTGEGQIIAVLDTMLLPEHEAFSGAVTNPRLSKAALEEKLSSLTIAGETTADELWYSDKIPFCYDYYEHDTDTTMEDAHGVHVSGIAAANGGEILGVAPDAQLLFLKVFKPDDKADEDAILAALEDAVTLGADCVNMSLGTEGGFSAYQSETIQRVYENLRAADVTLCASAGNEGMFSLLGWPTPVDMPDTSTLDSPASYDAPLAVANLMTRTFSRLRAGDAEYYVVDASIGSEGTIPALATLDGAELPAVDCGDGSEFPSEVQGAAAFIDTRSYWSDYGAMVLRAQEAGAKLVVFCSDNDTWQYERGFYMEDCSTPLAFLAYDTSREILKNEPATVSATGETLTFYPPDPSSAWGPVPNLKLKPEIAALGNQIYSAVAPGEASYERLSGTSMASPQAAGELAVLRQYLKAQDYDTPLTLTQLAETLLMCSATPVTDPVNGGGWISPRQQGAGLGNIISAMDAKAWIAVPDSERPKAELGAGEGPFTFSFHIHNLTDEPLRYRAEVLALVQDQADGRFTGSSTNLAGNGVDAAIRGVRDGVVTVPAAGTAIVTVTLTVTDAFSKAVGAAENGAFLDGFVRLYAEDGSGSDLGLPYLAFVGDWDAAPLMDLDGRYAAPRLANFRGVELGTNPAEMVTVTDEYGGEDTVPYVNPDAASISPTGDLQFTGFQSQTVLLRPAALVRLTMTNEAGEVIRQYEQENIRRSSPTEGSDTNRFMEYKMENGRSFFAFDAEGEWLPEGWYTYTAYARLSGGKQEASWTKKLYCDWTAPELDYSISGEPGSRTLSLTVSDNFHLSYFTITTPDTYLTSPDNFVVTDVGFAQGRYDDLPWVTTLTEADGAYTLTLDLEAFLQHLQALGLRTDVLKLEAKDYADNAATVSLAVAEDFYPLSLTLDPPELYLPLGEETQLQATILPENCPHDRITWESMDPTVATVDEDGTVHAVSVGWTEIYARAETPEGAFPLITSCQVSVSDFQPTGYLITFDPAGGTCPVPSMYTVEAEGLPYTLLSYPPAEREGYTFLGWFLEPEGGEPLGDFYAFTGDTTLYAHWEELAPPTPTPEPEPPETPEPEHCDGGDACPSKAFTDVDRSAKSWYHEPVDWAVTNKITTGTNATHFAPDRICTRAEAVTFLYRAAGTPAVQGSKNPFTDVKEGSFYYDAVLWAVETGVTTGVSEHAFAPDKKCTRAEIVTFLCRAKQAQPAAGAENPFTDVPAKSWYIDSALWAVQEGITTGDGRADLFKPDKGCTRAMIVTFLYRAK